MDNNREYLSEKILVDYTNPFNDKFDDFVTLYDTCSAEETQKLSPETNVAGAFKNTCWVVFENPAFGVIKSDIYGQSAPVCRQAGCCYENLLADLWATWSNSKCAAWSKKIVAYFYPARSINE